MRPSRIVYRTSGPVVAQTPTQVIFWLLRKRHAAVSRVSS